MTDRVLVPYDDSAPARKGIEYAFETFPDAAITALYVVPRPEGYWAAFESDSQKQHDDEKAQKRGNEVLEGARDIAADFDGELETTVETGKPAQVIEQEATAGGYETIVIGSHGREGVSRVLLGSVAEKVVRRSPVPVVVIR
ncbi:universal stress protein [Natrialba sp. PRR66]|uniref:universal stress protein n=1 Tax=Natrialba sp. PRR66 TaxID=3098146 RepID=UPI002B1E5379|nr:universal stress protein [Natrialba sp. PRR66]